MLLSCLADDILLLPSIPSVLKILPRYWLFTFLLNQSEWYMFTVYRKIIPPQQLLELLKGCRTY